MIKTIEIRKLYIRNLILSFTAGFVILYGLQHFGNFSYIVNSPTEYDSLGRMKMENYISGDTKVSRIYFQTYFDNKIETEGNNFSVADLNYANTEFKKYSTKSYYYTKATIEDFKYGIYISLGLFILTIFFTNIKIKLT